MFASQGPQQAFASQCPQRARTGASSMAILTTHAGLSRTRTCAPLMLRSRRASVQQTSPAGNPQRPWIFEQIFSFVPFVGNPSFFRRLKFQSPTNSEIPDGISFAAIVTLSILAICYKPAVWL
jgi:hypothetical protein